MAMTREEFDTLVRRLEREAERRPRAYKIRVFLLALLGYAYIFLIVAVLLLLIGALAWMVISVRRGGLIQVAGKLGVALLGLTYVIVRALWVRLSPPEGLVLHVQQAKPLFEAIDTIRRTLKSPKVHCLLLTDELNASVSQIPRLGLLGWQRNYLTVGLPLMYALSPEQFRAVLAHEFGHVCGAHGRFGAWIYRVRKSWYQLTDTLNKEQHWGSFIFDRFFRWYAPFFGAYSFVLARANEYEADRCAATMAGARHAADALINLELHGIYLSKKFWPGLHGKANHEPGPPSAPYTEMRWALHTGLESEYAQCWLDQALSVKTTSDDTHPCLADRLAALGEKAHAPTLVQETAAQHFLGTGVGPLTEELNRAWRERITPSWQQRYAYARETQERLTALERKARAEALSRDEAWQRATWTEEFRGTEAALPLYRKLVAEYPDHAGAHFALGRIWLSQDNAQGIDPLEKAMTIDATSILPGCELIYAFLKRHGRDEQAQPYFNRGVHQAELLELARQERSRLGFKDTYISHQLSGAEVARLRSQLARYPQIAEAYLVRKALTYFPEKSLHMLAVTIQRPWYRYHSARQDRKLSQELAQGMEFPGETLVFILNSETRKMRKIMKRIPGSEIYSR
jgi:Zn-dependent protease with chaperone function